METKMNAYTLLNINTLIKMIDENRVTELKTHLESLLTASQRDMVLGDQEMILGTASLLNEVAMHENDMSDKMCRIFFNRTRVILEDKGVL